VTEPRDRLRRIAERTVDHARRVAASVAAIGSARYPGGVDPIEVDDGTFVTGWARGRAQDVVALVVLLDGSPAALARLDPTDKRARRHITPWRADLELPAEREIEVSAVALFANGLSQLLDRQVVELPVRVPPELILPDAYLDRPEPGSVVEAPFVTVSGWATIDPIARIEIAFDGCTTAARQMALPRPDLAVHLDSPHAGFCGFEHVIDIGNHAPGDQVHLSVTAVDGDGRRHPVGDTFVTVGEVDPPEPVETERAAALRSRTERAAEQHHPAREGSHVLAVTHHLGLGGAQLYLQELLLLLLERPGVQCRVVSPTDGPLRHELEAHGIEVHVVGTYPTEPLAYETFMRQLVLIAAEFEATAVIANTTGADCGVDLASRIGVPVIWAIHESFAPAHFLLAAHGPGGSHPTAESRLADALDSATAVIFVADATRLLYASHGDPRRFVRIDYGIPLREIAEFEAGYDRSAARAELGFAPSDLVLLSVGTLEPRKAQASLLRAFARVAADHPEARLVLVGDRGDYYGERLRAYAESLDLGDRVRIEPVTPDSYPWFALADAFVLASDLESLPRSVLEAMAFGLPAIVGDVFGLSELIEDGLTGLLVAPRDLMALEAGLRRLLEMDEDERTKLGDRGASHVRAHYDSRGYAGEVGDLIAGFAADPTALPGDILDR
jgi:D-inositol-3-phosphate glycosyltransferase